LGLFTDMVVYPRSYFGARLHLIASMPATIVREGRLLYDSGEDGYHVQPVDKAKDTAEWMAKARNDLRAAGAMLALSPPDVGNALYHCQQAAEKAMKALLYWQDVPFHKTQTLQDLGKDSAMRDLIPASARSSRGRNRSANTCFCSAILAFPILGRSRDNPPFHWPARCTMRWRSGCRLRSSSACPADLLP
jgi:HEPN domain-containing protein